MSDTQEARLHFVVNTIKRQIIDMLESTFDDEHSQEKVFCMLGLGVDLLLSILKGRAHVIDPDFDKVLEVIVKEINTVWEQNHG